MAEEKTNRKGAAGIGPPPTAESIRVSKMRTAVQSAIVFAKDLIPEAKDIRLDEVKPNSRGWSVVISYSTIQSPTFAVMRGEEGPRVFKEVIVDSKSGQAQSLTVWK